MSGADTIYALSSGGLPSGVAVIRISGTQAVAACIALCGSLPQPRVATLKTIRSRNGHDIDRGLILFFPSPYSFTGDDCVEFQIHGGRAVVHAVLDALAAIPGLRHAEAGEFSRRAFGNGKLDLVEIEGLADLIAAETEIQRLLASEQANGGLSALYASWARRLTHARAMIEAELDFADEDDVPGSVSETIWQDMEILQAELGAHLDGAHIGAIIRDGFRIVISGPPNAGKSSLLNALAKRDIAIVTDVAGTTRDILSVDISLAGFVVKLFDTAGLRETADIVEREGIRRAKAVLTEANLILALSDRPDGFILPHDAQCPVLRIATKIDLGQELWDTTGADLMISTRQTGGLESLLMTIRDYLPTIQNGSSLAIPSRQRHQDQLKHCLEAVERSLQPGLGLDLKSEWLRQASNALGRITGSVNVEDLLDVIFSEFCIGK